MQPPSPTPHSPKAPTFTRLFRWLFSWRTLRRGLIGLAGLITLLAVVWTEENWRGKRAWEKYQREGEANGEKFDLQAFIPPPVPDDQNFAMTPFLAPLFDFNPLPLKPGQSLWRDTNAFHRAEDFGLKEAPVSAGNWTKSQSADLTVWAAVLHGKTHVPDSGESSTDRARAAADVLQVLEEYKPVLDELATASQRPLCRFNINYEGNPMDVLFPHLSVLKRSGSIFQLRALAELASGQSSRALTDTKMIWYLADAIKGEPVLISYLVRLAILNSSLQPVWEGLGTHQWTDAQLKELQQHLGKIDLLQEYAQAIRGERAFGNTAIEYNDSRLPKCLLFQNKLAINRMYQQIIPPLLLGEAAHRLDPAEYARNEAKLENEFHNGFTPYKIFARVLFPATGKAIQKSAWAQAGIDEAIVACALERYRLVHGQFPDTLDALSPQFAEHIPHDLITGEPLKYHRTEGGQFILYSVGWNGKDDGGKIALTEGSHGRVDITKGDWVWQYAGI